MSGHPIHNAQPPEAQMCDMFQLCHHERGPNYGKRQKMAAAGVKSDQNVVGCTLLSIIDTNRQGDNGKRLGQRGKEWI